MYIVRYAVPEADRPSVGVTEAGLDSPIHALDRADTLAALLALPVEEIRADVGDALASPATEGPTRLLPPVDGRTEVWASGVTYERSRDARVEESSEKTVYEKVYDATRPELFFKSPAWRVVLDGEPIGLRHDSALNVPEPELAVAVNSLAEVVGYLVCNDVSSRDIEGENPLYLPQAKIFAGACALSSGIRPVWEVPDASDLTITLTVTRGGAAAYREQTSTARMHRTPADLVPYLFAGDTHPAGALLSTGTGIIPGMDFTLQEGDEVTIDIASVGTLANRVVVGTEPFAFLSTDRADTYDRGR